MIKTVNLLGFVECLVLRALEDQKTLEDLNFSDLAIKYEEALKEKYINHNK